MKAGGEAGRSPRRSSRYPVRPCYDVRGTCVHVALLRHGRCQPQFSVQVTQTGAARETGSEQEVTGEKNLRHVRVHGVCVHVVCVCAHGVYVCMCVHVWCECAWVCVCTWCECAWCVCVCAWCVCARVVCVFMVCTRVWMCVCTERMSPSNTGEHSSYVGTGGDVTSRAQDVVRGHSPAAPWTVWTSLW